MRKFHISTQNMKEPAIVVYDEHGVLCQFDVTATGMKEKQVVNFKTLIPVLLDDLEPTFKGLAVTIVETDFEVTFEMFWQAYNIKVNRKRCEPLWDRMSKMARVKAWMGVKAYDKMLKSSEWKRAKADPDTYLRNEYWENEWR